MGSNSVKTLTDEVRNRLLQVLDKHPRESSHYAPQYEGDNHVMRYKTGLSIAKFYIEDYLKDGSKDDQKVYRQYKCIKYLPGYSDPKKQPSDAQYEQDNELKMLKPSITYKTAQLFYKDYEIKFDRRKCDLCITCHRLRNTLRDFPRDDPHRKDFEKELLLHQVEAEQGSALHRQRKQEARDSNGTKEVLQMDMIANPRTPLTNISEAFYKRILGTHGFIIVSTGNRPRSTLYLYDEETGEKGSDEVISCICHYIENKLPKTVKELDIWTDGCAGQCWNNYVATYFEMLLDEHSPLHEKAPNLVRITLWRNPRGHTYMEMDSQGGMLAIKGREMLNSNNT